MCGSCAGAATEIKEGLDAEVRELREPFEAVQKDLTKPVTEVKQNAVGDRRYRQKGHRSRRGRAQSCRR